MANIDDFKANLAGGGARPNQFRVTITPPSGIATGLDVRNASFLAKSSNLPGQTLGEIAVPFRGRNIYVTGDREFETWTTTFMNDTDFNIRNAIERWMNGINAHQANTGLTNPVDYQADLVVEQLDRDGNSLKTYNFRGCFPTNVSEIEVRYETVDAVEEFTVEFQVQYWESGTTS